ncbi:MAG: sodium:calcium antiporter, partial [Gammaproteobacteria bacterium]|nr:sodium:calcium antiporter [Gammaproteobacteria bacterium]
IYTRARQGHILSAGFGVVLIGLAGFNILISSSGFGISIGHVGVYSVVIMAFYLVAMATLFRYEKQQVGEFVEAEKDEYKAYSLRQIMARYAAAALAVIAAGAWLPFVAKHIAQQMGWYESFVGTLLVAFVTSLPETVVTVAALRLGAVDMAISNLFGSNLFNIMILTIDDALYLPGPLLADVSVTHAVSAVSAIMMTGIAIVALLYRPTKRVLKTVGWASIFLLTAYLLNSYVMFLYGG